MKVELPWSLGEVNYDAYRASSDGKSLVTGEPLPPYAETDPQIQQGWSEGAVAVIAAYEASGRTAPERYALVEQMGYRRTIGAIRETEFAGRPMLEVTDLTTGTVHLKSPDSFYEITLMTRAQAERATRTGAHAPAAIGRGSDAWGTEESDLDDNQAEAGKPEDEECPETSDGQHTASWHAGGKCAACGLYGPQGEADDAAGAE